MEREDGWRWQHIYSVRLLCVETCWKPWVDKLAGLRFSRSLHQFRRSELLGGPLRKPMDSTRQPIDFKVRWVTCFSAFRLLTWLQVKIAAPWNRSLEALNPGPSLSPWMVTQWIRLLHSSEAKDSQSLQSRWSNQIQSGHARLGPINCLDTLESLENLVFSTDIQWKPSF